MSPSAPRPRWRSQTARASAARSVPAGTTLSSSRRKSFPKACALMISKALRNREAAEDPGQTGRETNAGIARGHADDQPGVHPDGALREPAPQAHRAARVGPGRRIPVADVKVAVHFPDHFEPLADRTGERQAVGQHVVLAPPL